VRFYHLCAGFSLCLNRSRYLIGDGAEGSEDIGYVSGGVGVKVAIRLIIEIRNQLPLWLLDVEPAAAVIVRHQHDHIGRRCCSLQSCAYLRYPSIG